MDDFLSIGGAIIGLIVGAFVVFVVLPYLSGIAVAMFKRALSKFS